MEQLEDDKDTKLKVAKQGRQKVKSVIKLWSSCARSGGGVSEVKEAQRAEWR